MRVLVTRAVGQASALAELLAQRGMEPVLIPTIEIAPPASYCGLDAALTTLRAYDWVVFTSANAVRAFAERARTLGLRADPRRVAVLGPATANAVGEALGCGVDLMPAQYVTEALALGLLPYAPGAAVLLVRAAVARDVLPEALASAGAMVTIVEAYRNVVPQDSVTELQTLFSSGGPDAITFTSASTATNLRRLLDTSLLAVQPGTVLASIGPVTSRAMREVGLEPTVEARESTTAGLVSVLEEFVAESESCQRRLRRAPLSRR